MNKYYFCIKNIAFEDCHKNATNVERRNLERAFLISRASDEQKFCDGIDFKLSYPRNLRQNDCEKNYVEVKQACESSYVETYLKNKSDKSLCRCVFKSFCNFRLQPIATDTDSRQTQMNQSKCKVKNKRPLPFLWEK